MSFFKSEFGVFEPLILPVSGLVDAKHTVHCIMVYNVVPCDFIVLSFMTLDQTVKVIPCHQTFPAVLHHSHFPLLLSLRGRNQE